MDISTASNTAFILKITGKTSGRAVMFIKLEYIYPECLFLIEKSPQLFPLQCLASSCPKNQTCMDTLARRVKYLFDNFLDTDVLLLYYTYRDKINSYRSAIFTRELEEPRLITFNRSAWQKLKNIGTVYQWTIPNWLSLGLVGPQKLDPP